MKFLKFKFILSIGLVIFLVACKPFLKDSSFEYKKVPYSYTSTVRKFALKALESKDIAANSYKLEKSLPQNYDTTGNTDYTHIIQQVLDANSIVIFPNFPLLINEKGLSVRSNSKLYFEAGSKLIIEKNNLTNYEILRLHGVHNVELISPTLFGDRDIHMGSKGEWGFGISIRGAKNIRVVGATIKNCWGDGVYIGTFKNTTNSNIKIANCFIDNNRRNGISIISGKDVEIKNTTISNSNGTYPMSGIDLEPNTNSELLSNIVISNVTTFNNYKEGILIVLRSLYGGPNNKVTIKIENHFDDNSGHAMGFALKNENAKAIEGTIKIVNAQWKNRYKNFVRFHDGYSNKVDFKSNKTIDLKRINSKINLNKEMNFEEELLEAVFTNYKLNNKNQ